MLRYKTEIAWFSRLVRHLVRKWRGSILTTPELAWGNFCKIYPHIQDASEDAALWRYRSFFIIINTK